jgi:hypothetical protein
MEIFPCYGRERGQMVGSEQGTVNYLAVEVRKKSVFGRYFFGPKIML